MKRIILSLLLLIPPILAFAQAPRPPIDRLDLMTDVTITNKLNGQPLMWNGTKWVNVSQSGMASEVWISSRTDSPTNCVATNVCGTGSIFDPFDGSTQAKFDAVMAHFGTNIRIHLGIGTFQTNASTRTWLILSGWTIEGEGMYLTTVQMLGSFPGGGGGTVLRNTYTGTGANNITIKNLTCDANWPALASTADLVNGERNATAMAVNLWGSYNTVDHVRAINTYGSGANGQEHFAILIATPSTADATDNTISYCRAESVQGTYGNPFAVEFSNDNTRHNRNCHVYGCTAIGNDPNFNSTQLGFNSGGVNTANVMDSDFHDNLFIDCESVFHHDTGSLSGVKIYNNKLIRGFYGLLFNTSASATVVEAYNNTLGIKNRIVGGGVIGVLLNGSGSQANFNFHDNVITYDPSGSGLNQFYNFYVTALSNSNISYNVPDPSGGAQYFGAITKLTRFNNRTPLGGTPTGLEDTAVNNAVDSSLIGAQRITATLGSGGAFYYIQNAAYTIASGDRLQYEVYCDSRNPNCKPNDYFQTGGGALVANAATDQNGIIINNGDISAYATNKWYYRDVDLTASSGSVTAWFRMGREVQPVGTYIDYYRNIKVVDSTGALKVAYYTPESQLAIGLGGSSSATNLSGVQNFAGPVVAGAPLMLATYKSGNDGSGTHFLADDNTFKSVGGGGGSTISVTTDLIKGDGAGNGIALGNIGAFTFLGNGTGSSALATPTQITLGMIQGWNDTTLTEAATITIPAGTRRQSVMTGTCTALAISGSLVANAPPTVLAVTVTGGPYTIGLDRTCNFEGENTSGTSRLVNNGYHEFRFVQHGDGSVWLADTTNQLPAFTGDTTKPLGSTVQTTVKVNGVAYPTNPSTNTVPVVTSANTVTYEAVPNAALASSSFTIAGTTLSLGGSITLDTIIGVSSNGLIKRTGANTLALAVAGTDFAAAPTGSANTPLFNNGTGGFTNGTRSGNTTTVATTSGTLTSGDCVKFDANGNLVDNGSTCAGASAVSSVSNSDGTLTILPTTGAVVASLNLGNANTWTAAETVRLSSSGIVYPFVASTSNAGSTTRQSIAVRENTNTTSNQIELGITSSGWSGALFGTNLGGGSLNDQGYLNVAGGSFILATGGTARMCFEDTNGILIGTSTAQPGLNNLGLDGTDIKGFNNPTGLTISAVHGPITLSANTGAGGGQVVLQASGSSPAGSNYVDVSNGAALRLHAVTFANRNSAPAEGMIQAFTDSTTATWGATITGTGTNHVLGYFDGTNWTVVGL